jgi:hypothetical protein
VTLKHCAKLRNVLKYLKTKLENVMEDNTKLIRAKTDIETYKKIAHFCVERDLYMTDLVMIALLEYIENHTK